MYATQPPTVFHPRADQSPPHNVAAFPRQHPPHMLAYALPGRCRHPLVSDSLCFGLAQYQGVPFSHFVLVFLFGAKFFVKFPSIPSFVFTPQHIRTVRISKHRELYHDLLSTLKTMKVKECHKLQCAVLFLLCPSAFPYCYPSFFI